MMNRFLSIKIAAVFVAVVVVFAGSITWCAEDGGQPGVALDWGVGARPVAMGGAFVATADGAIGAWWNPAGIASARQDALEMAIRRMSFDRQAGYVSYIHPFGKEEAAMGLSWVYAGVGDVFSRDIDGQIGDKISDFTNAFTFTFARRFTRRNAPLGFGLGLSLRYAQHNIANIDAYTVGLDMGAQLRYRFYRRGMAQGEIPAELRLGLSVQRLNQKYPWTTSDYWISQGEGSGSTFDEKFPLVMRLGGGVLLLNGRLLGAADVKVDAERGATLHVGAEARPQRMIALRAGVDDGHFTFGGGLEPKVSSKINFSLDYAFAVQPDQIDAEHIFSLGFRF